MLIPGNNVVEQEDDIANNKIPLFISRRTMTVLGFIIYTQIGGLPWMVCFEA